MTGMLASTGIVIGVEQRRLVEGLGVRLHESVVEEPRQSDGEHVEHDAEDRPGRPGSGSRTTASSERRAAAPASGAGEHAQLRWRQRRRSTRAGKAPASSWPSMAMLMTAERSHITPHERAEDQRHREADRAEQPMPARSTKCRPAPAQASQQMNATTKRPIPATTIGPNAPAARPDQPHQAEQRSTGGRRSRRPGPQGSEKCGTWCRTGRAEAGSGVPVVVTVEAEDADGQHVRSATKAKPAPPVGAGRPAPWRRRARRELSGVCTVVVISRSTPSRAHR